MRWFRLWPRRKPAAPRPAAGPLTVELLEDRTLLAASVTLSGGVLAIAGGPGVNRITVLKDSHTPQQIDVLDGGREVAAVASSAVTQITVDANGVNNVVRITNDVLQPAILRGGPGINVFYAGGGPTLLVGGPGGNKLVAGSGPTILVGGGVANQLQGGPGPDTFVRGPGANLVYDLKATDVTNATAADVVVSVPGPTATATQLLTTNEVGTLLQRAAAAAHVNNAIIAVVDRAGNLLGVRVESGVAADIQNNPQLLSFAIDGAIAKARTGAFFANDQAPLTSRTVQFLSQTTITQREVESYPFITDPNSTARGPGFVAPIGIGGSFPPGVPHTPLADLFGIEDTNRDSIINPGPDHIRGTADDIVLPSIFNVPLAAIPPGQNLVGEESYGFLRYGFTNATSRGIATLPGGIPIFKNSQLVGGIGVFFPGRTGFADEENSALSSNYNPSKPDLSMYAEWMAFAAVGGSRGAGVPVGTLNGVAPLPGFDLPFGRIDLNGITLPLFGPGGIQGPQNLLAFGVPLGVGNPNDGADVPIDQAGTLLQAGQPAPTGTLVTPRNGVGAGPQLNVGDVQTLINQAIAQSNITRAAIRLPRGSPARFVIAVTDTQGNVIGLYREPDATVFSIDVAVAKARNVAYYANPAELQPIDQVPGVPLGAAFTNRTFRYLADPRYPEGVPGTLPGPFSVLNSGGTDPTTGLTVGAPLPASAFQAALGYDAFNPQTNFHDPFNIANQNGAVFFPGSVPLYKNGVLVGGLGISGDGVTQDDVETFATAQGYLPPGNLEVDQFFFRGVRLPYLKFNRNPEEP